MLNSYFCNTLFKVKSFEDYVDLIEKLGLNICGYSPYRKYWMPSFKGLYLFVDRVGKTHSEVCTHSTYDNFKMLHDKEINRLQELKNNGIKLISSMGI